MCGISALISPTPFPARLIEQMTDIIKHRGPDGFGYFHENGIALGHRRLAILDCSESGHQPMHFRDKAVLTYNGEIYNYIEIKTELEKEGYEFHGHSDTEVILAAYDFWQEHCLSRFNGMWSFVLWDRERRKVFAARDRFGVKPLYYWRTPQGLWAFGSETKQFTVLDGWQARLNKPIASEFVATGLHDHTDETFFEGVYQVPPGHSVSFEMSALPQGPRLPVRRWYFLPQDQLELTSEEAAAQVFKTLQSSVQLRLRSDVPVGSCLSGGIDSSTIVALVAGGLSSGSRQKTFSALSEDKNIDESSHIQKIVSKFKTDHHTTTPDFAELWGLLDKLTWHQDEPFGSSSIFAQWKVFELARRENCIVMLDGQGADEQLGGYPEFTGALLADHLRMGRLNAYTREALALSCRSRISLLTVLARTLRAIFPGFATKLQSLSGRRVRPGLWLKSPIRDLHREKALSFGELARYQVQGGHLQMLLRYEDRDSMAHGIEARVPFVDYRFVELATRLPSSLRVNAGVTKSILRSAMRGFVPDAILDRRDKIGFATAESHWVRTHPSLFRAELRQAVDLSAGLLSEQVLRDFEAMLSGRIPYNSAFWRVISFGRWLQVFQVDGTQR
ncbi:MAG: asparagine synthase (glutamine-hydrolyzing) [Bdellovibrionaceae bacterium]|nr:asparagine synthase (glutamine-hydrolyzing) [Pseudobdellovibrionaceae bacterium]